nr:MAG TPA: hypothetical protein [Caudoviricetes sp.]
MHDFFPMFSQGVVWDTFSLFSCRYLSFWIMFCIFIFDIQ